MEGTGWLGLHAVGAAGHQPALQGRKALGVVLLGMAADGAGLTELSAAEPSLQNKQKKKMFLGDKLHQDSSVSTLLEHRVGR